MLHARTDYDRIQDPFNPGDDSAGIPLNEPVFIVRAQDPYAPVAMTAWVEQVEKECGVSELTEAVRDHIDRVYAWQQDVKVKRFPDMPEGCRRVT